ncbi:MAG: hypothetical protein D6733_05400 [Methanobacteriota archaeon]|nr:MAG: hypothetical protein D6733_05400 [Euryarchaeota archaeon]
MDESVEKRIEYLHMLLGLVAGVVSGLSGENGLVLGALIGYMGFFISRSLFSLSPEEFNTNTWLSKGAMPFLMIWLPVWIFVYNL